MNNSDYVFCCLARLLMHFVIVTSDLFTRIVRICSALHNTINLIVNIIICYLHSFIDLQLQY